MLHIFKLLLPALIPSWRFFETVAPSPRIEFALLENAKAKSEEHADQWREFRPRPAYVSPITMMKRMVWNPRWNETLFIVSCAERIISGERDGETEHSAREIIRRIRRDIMRNMEASSIPPYVQFRLVFIDRDGDMLQKHRLYESPVYPFYEGVAA